MMARSRGGVTPRARQWAELSAQWERSGLRLREFCEQHGVRVSTFAWWRRQLAQRQRRVGAAVELVEVKRVATDTAAVVEVVLPNAIRLRVPAGFERQSLQELLALVRAC